MKPILYLTIRPRLVLISTPEMKAWGFCLNLARTIENCRMTFANEILIALTASTKVISVSGMMIQTNAMSLEETRKLFKSTGMKTIKCARILYSFAALFNLKTKSNIEFYLQSQLKGYLKTTFATGK
jgi:hypothetical protein